MRLVLGVVCAIVGVAGALLPILPGWIFFGFSALLLFPRARFTRRLLELIEQRFPSAAPLLSWLR
jgi:uncharacterized membrane protein YbaN (DUF454 family)